MSYLSDISDTENAEWEARYDAIAKIIGGVHDELGELISQQLWDILVEFFSDNPSVNYFYNTQQMTKDALFVIVPLLEDITKKLGLE